MNSFLFPAFMELHICTKNGLSGDFYSDLFTLQRFYGRIRKKVIKRGIQMNEIELKNRKLNIQKLLSFGFTEQNSLYTYSLDLLDGQMKMNISISQEGKICTEVTDNISGEEYVLHLVSSAIGSFVGQIRTEYEEVVGSIVSNCFEPDVFKSSQALNIIAYIRNKYGDELEFLWEKFPDNAIWRRKDNKKWYAALLIVSKRKLGFDSDELIEIIDLRMKPKDIETQTDNKKYFPGYHMNKKHWITICLDSSVSLKEIYARIDDSYNLT